MPMSRQNELVPINSRRGQQQRQESFSDAVLQVKMTANFQKCHLLPETQRSRDLKYVSEVREGQRGGNYGHVVSVPFQ